MTIKEQFAEFMEMIRKPQKDINMTLFFAKAMTIMAALEDESSPVDHTVFECMTGDEVRQFLGGMLGLMGSLVAKDAVK